MASVLVLWDIDHTLIETRGVGGQVYAEAFAKVTGRPLSTMPNLAGRTEPVIFREALKANHVDDREGLYELFAGEQARGYASRLGELRRRGRALPGAAEALRALCGRAGVTQSVLTGNTRPSAEIKLRAFGLDEYLDLEVGAYGTDDDTRANLVAIACQRAGRAHRRSYAARDTVLIGDTPNDVTAALSSGARIIAVATGSDTADSLSAAGAATVLPDLTDTATVLDAIFMVST
jgi:phosphoglycolate phosphatase-like HAD superfamily hydrolase